MTTWALDLDGVVWRGKQPIPGSAAAVDRLRAAGHQVVFATNNSAATVAQQETKLASFGIEAEGLVVSSATAAAYLVESGEIVLCLGGPGISEAVANRGAKVVEAYEHGQDVPDVVLVGLDLNLSYSRLTAAVQAILAGARFLATNNDPTYPTETGLWPGAGAIVGAIQAATGTVPKVAGKPNQPQAELIRSRFGLKGVMVGDRPDTDGLFARALGYEFYLVLSGVTGEGELPVDPPADRVGPDLAAIVDEVLGIR